MRASKPKAYERGMSSTTIKKRSIIIDGRHTRISLEDAFWTSLRHIAHERDQFISHLIAEIDGARQNENLCSTIRIFVLHYYHDKLARHRLMVVLPTPPPKGRRRSKITYGIHSFGTAMLIIYPASCPSGCLPPLPCSASRAIQPCSVVF